MLKHNKALVVIVLLSSANMILVEAANAEIVQASFYTRASAQREGTSGVFTANGEKFNERAQTCAHPTFKFGTILRVQNPKNGKWIYCRVNDVGPAKWTGHKLDLTPRGFELLGIPTAKGIAKLDVKKQEIKKKKKRISSKIKKRISKKKVNMRYIK